MIGRWRSRLDALSDRTLILLATGAVALPLVLAVVALLTAAALALIATFYVYDTGQSWWGALPELPLVAVAALLVTGRSRSGIDAEFAPQADDGMRIAAKLTTARILAGAHDQHLAVTITAPRQAHTRRAPLSVAVVIDRSGSMNGAPMEHAKDAASRLIGQLDPTDAFTVISYSSGDQVVMPMSRATDANKLAARAAIR